MSNSQRSESKGNNVLKNIEISYKQKGVSFS